MSHNQNHIAPRHWPPFLTAVDASAYLGVSEKTFRRWVSAAGIDPVPLINRFDRSELDNIGVILRQKAAEEAKIMLSALKNEEMKTFS